MSEDRKGNMGGVVFALIFAVCFGAVGVFAVWVMGSTVLDGISARDWVRVKADVVSYGGGNIAYKYKVGEREFQGDKLGPGPLAASEIDEALDARISTARSEQKPITVFVNPDNPQQSLVDPEIPWQLVVFMTPFALGFGGVGVGALVVGGKLLFGGDAPEQKTTVQTAGSGAGFLWIFAFFWNSLAFPISLIAVPDMIRSGEWWGLLILIFPLVGLLLIWAAISTTWSGIRLGRVEFHLQGSEHRLGSVVSGYITGKRVKPGDAYRVTMACITKADDGSARLTHWSQEKNLRVAQTPQGARVSFSFDTPDRLPPAAGERTDTTDWRAQFFVQGESAPAYTFYFQMLPPAGATMVDDEPEDQIDLEEQPVPAGIPKGLEGIAAFVGKERIEERIEAMSTTERAQLHAHIDQLTPGQKQALEKFGKYAHHGPLIKKLVIAVIVLFVLVQFAGVASFMLFGN